MNMTKLTARETEYFMLYLDGNTTGEIATALKRSPKTAEAQLTRIAHKLGLQRVKDLRTMVFRAAKPVLLSQLSSVDLRHD